jgi:hypothetical protein
MGSLEKNEIVVPEALGKEIPGLLELLFDGSGGRHVESTGGSDELVSNFDDLLPEKNWLEFLFPLKSTTVEEGEGRGRREDGGRKRVEGRREGRLGGSTKKMRTFR